MTVSRNRRPIGAGLAVALGLTVAMPAWAQQGGPHSLSPKDLAPPPGFDNPARSSEADSGDSIRVDRLGEVDVDAVGTLSEAEGGFGTAMWHGTGRGLVRALLPRLPVSSVSPAMQDLMRRLLLTAAVPPEGEGTDTAGKLIVERVRLLAETGDLEATRALLEAVPARRRSPDLVRLQADLQLLAGERAKACSLAANRIQQTEAAYWQKLFVFCQALAGERDKAQLGVSLLRETGEAAPVYFRLFDAVLNDTTPEMPELAEPQPLHLAMARAAGIALPETVLRTAGPMMLRAVALDEAVALPRRVQAGEKAEALGALPVLALRDIYGQIPFTEDELANPLAPAGKTEDKAEDSERGGSGPEAAEAPEWEPSVRARALLYRAALAQDAATARAEAVAAALSQAQARGRYPQAVRVLQPVLEDLEPAANLAWFAADATRALLLAGQVERAGAWYRLMQRNAGFNKDLAAAGRRLKPLMKLAGAAEADDWQPRDLALFAQSVGDGAEGRDYAALVYNLLEGFEVFVPDPLWADLAPGAAMVAGEMPHAALWHQLPVAGRRGRLGEVVMLSLVALGAGGPAEAHPVVLDRVLGSLRAVGLDAEARRLAVEAAVVAGR